MSETVLQRGVRWYADKLREQLRDLPPLADVAPFRAALRRVRSLPSTTPKLLEAGDLLEAEIAERELVRERAERVTLAESLGPTGSDRLR